MIILDRLNRKPYFFEKWFIKYQNTAFNKAEIMISLFKDAKKLITERHGKQIFHLDTNVVNDINFAKPTAEVRAEMVRIVTYIHENF
jgi:hypothetical protein